MDKTVIIDSGENDLEGTLQKKNDAKKKRNPRRRWTKICWMPPR